MTLLDTHAWLWLVAEPKRLSTRARRHIDREMRSGPLLVSSMSVWEVAKLSERGRLALTMGVEDWVAHCEALPFLSFVPVGNRIALELVRLLAFPSPGSCGPYYRGHRAGCRRYPGDCRPAHPCLLPGPHGLVGSGLSCKISPQPGGRPS